MGYILARLGQAFITLLVVAVVVFVVVRLTGDPVAQLLPNEATAADEALLREYLGMDKSVLIQFSVFFRQLAVGELGVSMFSRRPVTELIRERLPHSVALGIFAMVLTLLLSFPIGIFSAIYRGKGIDLLARMIAAVGQSVPQFWVGLLLMQIFAIDLKLVPVAGAGGFSAYILPGFTLGLYVLASVTRLLRSSMLDVLDCDFIKQARIKGVSEAGVIWKHALRNALIPVVTFVGLYCGFFVTGAVVVETVFAWPGLGRLLVQGVMQHDYALVQGIIVLICAALVTINIAIDILYRYIDPRIQYK